ncbi:M48 family metalloprotease [Kitasatospora sp. MAP5-34]|uniref:M48 family metalloprotease n=1 Tax=Kitasatospora sp. MAP5-34 TaxID=3035102 RepID=UPI0024764B1D|nr:M48 family metalloprotease [Kitasatospora sp. MAP5-34]MDH6579781.1 Zn-dependent protease with chaperone function [Kitasatospora sp. MAP5-34]
MSGRSARLLLPGPGAGTTRRFVLLAGVFTAGSLAMLSDLLLLVTDPRNTSGGCALAAGADPDHTSLANYLPLSVPAYRRCVDTNVGPWKLLGLPLLGTAGVLALAVLVHLLIPRWKQHRTQAVPLDQAGLTEWLTALATRCGLPRTPAFVVDRAAPFSANAVALGRFGRYSLRLDLGLVTLYRTDRRAFEATLLHEYAHLRNRDVDLTYLTIALWRVFLACVVLPFVVAVGWQLLPAVLAPTFHTPPPAPLARDLALAAAMVLLMQLTTAELLRALEIHADLDAVAHGADPGYWTRQQRRRTAERRRGPVAAAGRAAGALLRTHPSWEARVAALADACAPVAVRPPQLVLTGVSVTVLGYLLTFTPGLNTYLPAWLGNPGVWPAAVLAAVVAAGAVQRSVVHAPPGAARPSGLRAGLWFGAGHLLGELVCSQFLGLDWAPRFPEAFLLLLPVLVPAAVLWWTAGCAALCAGQRPGPRRSVAGAATVCVAAASFAWWYGWWQAAGTSFAAGMPYSSATALSFLNAGFEPSQQLAPSTTSYVIANLTLIVVVLALFRWTVWLTVALWLVPLAIPLLGGVRARATGVLPGLLCGAAVGAGALVLTHRAQVWIRRDEQPFVPALTVYTGWLFVLLLCGAVLAGAAGALLGRGSGAAAAAGAGTATAVGLTVLLAVNATDGCVPALETVRASCGFPTGNGRQLLTFYLPQFLAVAGMASIVAALPFAAAARLRRRAPVTARCPEAEPSSKYRAVHRTCCAVGCLALLGLGVVGYTTPGGTGSGPAGSGPDPTVTALQRRPVDSLTAGLQVWAWGYFGGLSIMGQYEDALAAADRSVGPDGNVDAAALRRACTDLLDAAGRAGAYFPVPVASEQAAWTAALANTRTQARHCLDAPPPAGPAETDRFFTALDPQPDPVAAVIDHLLSLSGPTQQLLLPSTG